MNSLKSVIGLAILVGLSGTAQAKTFHHGAECMPASFGKGKQLVRQPEGLLNKDSEKPVTVLCPIARESWDVDQYSMREDVQVYLYGNSLEVSSIDCKLKQANVSGALGHRPTLGESFSLKPDYAINVGGSEQAATLGWELVWEATGDPSWLPNAAPLSLQCKLPPKAGIRGFLYEVQDSDVDQNPFDGIHGDIIDNPLYDELFEPIDQEEVDPDNPTGPCSPIDHMLGFCG